MCVFFNFFDLDIRALVWPASKSFYVYVYNLLPVAVGSLLGKKQNGDAQTMGC
jgi:hypothetical protein